MLAFYRFGAFLGSIRFTWRSVLDRKLGVEHESLALGFFAGRPSNHLPIRLASSGDVGILFEGRVSATCDAQSNLCRHDAVYVDRRIVSNLHVYLAGHDVMVAGVPLR